MWKGYILNESSYMTKLQRRSKKTDDCLVGAGGGRDEQMVHRRVLGQWKYSAWYYKDEYMPLY